MTGPNGRRIAATLRNIAIVLVIVALPTTAIFFVMSRPETPPLTAPGAEYASELLDPVVGLYDMSGHERVLVTYSARGGLAMYGLNGTRFSRADYLSRSITPTKDAAYLWEPFENEPIRTLRLIEDGERLIALEWEDESRSRQAASRIKPAFEQREVTWKNGIVGLTGTLFSPDGPAVAGAVIVHGSGWSNRDNLWYLHFAIRLVESRVATLFPDKRGSGKSEGDWRTSSFADFAEDALAAREHLAKLTRLAPNEIGLVGMSQGGSGVAPLASSLTADLPFIINVSGSNVPTREQLVHETYQNLRQMGVPNLFAWFMHPYAMAIAQRKRRTWWELNGDYDPQPHLQQSGVPLLVLYGQDDEHDNVPVTESVRRFQALKRDNVVVKVYDGVGHGLFTSSNREILPDALDRVVDWVVQSTTQP